VPIEWKQAYRTALQENERQRIIVAVRLAESAITARLQELEGLTKLGHGPERASLRTALKDLQAIKLSAGLPSR
jgi:hypothetical protein